MGTIFRIYDKNGDGFLDHMEVDVTKLRRTRNSNNKSINKGDRDTILNHSHSLFSFSLIKCSATALIVFTQLKWAVERDPILAKYLGKGRQMPKCIYDDIKYDLCDDSVQSHLQCRCRSEEAVAVQRSF